MAPLVAQAFPQLPGGPAERLRIHTTHTHRKGEGKRSDRELWEGSRGLHFLSPNLLWQLFPWEW